MKRSGGFNGWCGCVVGSEMAGGVNNIYVADCTFMGTDVGLRIKSTRGRGGVVENIYIDNINMINIPNEPLLFDLFYGGKGPGEETEEERAANTKNDLPAVTEETPAFRNIHISNVYSKRSGRAIFFNGLPEMPIENVTVKNVIMSEAKEGVFLSQTKNVTLENVVIETTTPQSELNIRNSKDLTIDGRTYEDVDAKGIQMDFKK